ncbi:hypothetical protein CYR52_05600 [Chimaeribacter arupi]|nr:hypothetical protein CYR52_05600 [Chimaeribacter arupi]
MFKSLIALAIEFLLMPTLIISFGLLWLHTFPEYWGRLMLASVFFVLWLYYKIIVKFEKL